LLPLIETPAASTVTLLDPKESLALDDETTSFELVFSNVPDELDRIILVEPTEPLTSLLLTDIEPDPPLCAASSVMFEELILTEVLAWPLTVSTK
jgi:hypothetical protein